MIAIICCTLSIGLAFGYLIAEASAHRRLNKLNRKHRILKANYDELVNRVKGFVKHHNLLVKEHNQLINTHNADMEDFNRFRQELKAYRELIPLPPDYRKDEFENVILEGDQP